MAPTNPEVMFFLPHLGGGGAEMNAVRISQELPKYGFKTSFAVCRGPGSYERFLAPETDVKTLDTGRIHSSRLRLIRSVAPLRKLVEQQKPAILCAVMGTPSLVALTAIKQTTSKTKVILSIQNSLKAEYINQKSLLSKLEFSLIKKIFPCADHVIALSNGVAAEIVELIPALTGKVSMIYNAGISFKNRSDQKQTLENRPPTGKLIVACGRLVEQKGYPYLIKAFAQVAKASDAHLWILGDGPLKESLVALTINLNVDTRVQFLGFKDNPQAYMQAADIFVLSSLWEGFGNVIVEAMATGTAVISTDCPHGPNEIISNGVNGLLVPPGDENALAQALIRVLGNDSLRNQLSSAAIHRAQDFSPDILAQQYAQVFSHNLAS